MAASDCLIICKSVHHGNTARVARAIADVLGAEVAAPEDVPASSVGERRLLGFGSGVYYGRMHPALRQWLDGLPDAPAPTRPAFLFTTSGLPFLSSLWTASLRRLLARKGFDLVATFACRGHDTWGPLGLVGGLHRRRPNDDDLERARTFARRLAAGGMPMLRRAS